MDQQSEDFNSRESKLARLKENRAEGESFENENSEPLISPGAAAEDLNTPEVLDNEPAPEPLSDLPPGLHRNEAGEWVQRLKIDGREIDQPYDTYHAQAQKYAAGDARLQHSVEFQKSLDLERTELDTLRESLQEQEQTLSKTIAPTVEPVSDDGVVERAGNIVDSLFTGKREDAVSAVADLISASSQPSSPSVDADELIENATTQTLKAIDDRQAATDRDNRQKAMNQAYQAFANEFTDIVGDPALFEMANSETDNIVAEHPDWTPSEVMTEAGTRVRAQVVPTDPVDDPSVEPTQDVNDAQNRVTHKANLQPIPNVRTTATQVAQVEAEVDNSPGAAIARARAQRRGIRNEI